MNILVIRRGAIGDVIMSTGIVRALYQMHNQPAIDVSTDVPEVFANSIYVRRAGRSDQFDREQYDLVVDLDLAYESTPAMHAIDAYAARAGIDPTTTDLHTELFVMPEHHAFLSSIGLPERFVVLHQRKHFWSNRNLPEDFYIDLASKIVGLTGHAVVQIGGQYDLGFGNLDGCLYDLTNQLSLHQTAALISRSKAFIGVDAGPLHIASTTDVPIVGFFTSVRAEYREPRNRPAPHINVASNINCYGCVEKLPAPLTQYHCGRGDDECTRRFSVDDIIEKIKTLL
jgi:ADP-heptose:LPS heptosyltransferase